MRLFWLTTLTMIAFAANSVLNRLAVGEGLVGPLDFAAIRLVSGAVALAVLVVLRRGVVWPGARGRVAGVVCLLLYLVPFSLAYRQLDAGVGALILFGMVQVTMFGGALVQGEPVTPARWVGALVAFGGLVWLLLPRGPVVTEQGAMALMALAGLGWGLYSLAGRVERDALAATAANFVLAVPVMLGVLAVVPGDGVAVQAAGVALALVSGVVTSGMGYALWYAILPRLGASRAGVAQLSVPVIALAGGAAVLGEVPSAGFLTAAAVVMAGVALSLWARR